MYKNFIKLNRLNYEQFYEIYLKNSAKLLYTGISLLIYYYYSLSFIEFYLLNFILSLLLKLVVFDLKNGTLFSFPEPVYYYKLIDYFIIFWLGRNLKSFFI